MKLEFHPAVQQDFIQARDYYQTEGGPHLADRFEREFQACLAVIQVAPSRFPFTSGITYSDVSDSGIEDPVTAFERLIETYSVSEFIARCTPSVPDLERAWAKKKGQPASQAKESLKRCSDLC